MADEPKDIPEPRYRRVTNWDRLGENIAQLYAEAKRLVELAAHGRTDNGDQLDRKTAELGLKVIPEPGLLHILTPRCSSSTDYHQRLRGSHSLGGNPGTVHDLTHKKHTSVRVAEVRDQILQWLRQAHEIRCQQAQPNLPTQPSGPMVSNLPCRGEREFLFIEDPLERPMQRAERPRRPVSHTP